MQSTLWRKHLLVSYYLFCSELKPKINFSCLKISILEVKPEKMNELRMNEKMNELTKI